MEKNKIIAAIVTSLFLFALIRACSPKNPPETLDQEESFIEEVEDNTPAEPLELPPQKIQKALPKVSVKKEKPKAPVKILEEQDSARTNKTSFKEKTEFAFFKVEDGLALVGGDVILGELSEEQKKIDFKGRLLKQKPEPSKLWPSAQIPFGFAVGFPESLKGEVNKAITYFNQETVMEFFAADPELDADIIVFQLRNGAPCSSYLGRSGGQQPIYLNNTCKSQDVLHEIMHALAFVHEQQREDRDRSLKILWENIKEDYDYNFAILPDSMVHPYQGSVFDIDFTSVMMYPDEAFAKPSTKSMQSKTSDKIAPIINGLSDIDKKRLEFLYGS